MKKISVSDIYGVRGQIIVEKVTRIDVILLEKKLDTRIGGNNIVELEEGLKISNTMYPLGRDVLGMVKNCINETLCMGNYYA